MRVRATIHMPADAAGFSPLPGQEFDVDPDVPDVQRFMNVGFLVPIIDAPMLDDLKPRQHRRQPPVDS